MRGEYPQAVDFFVQQGGSSPRAWGIHIATALFKLRLRFIPTCVGNTIEALRDQLNKAVHPHVRGEYIGGLE